MGALLSLFWAYFAWFSAYFKAGLDLVFVSFDESLTELVHSLRYDLWTPSSRSINDLETTIIRL